MFAIRVLLRNRLLSSIGERREEGYDHRQRQLSRPNLPVIDELSFVPLSHTGAELLL